MVKKTTALTPQTLKTQLDMKLQYCKPETEVDLLVLEEFILYDLMRNKPSIKSDLQYEEDYLEW